MSCAVSRRACLTVLLGVLLAGRCVWAADAPIAATQAQSLMYEGKYAEAEEAFGKLPADQAVVAALGKARCQHATGHRGAAVEILSAAFSANSNSADLAAELALIAVSRGDYPTAEKLLDQAFKLAPDHVQAHWVRGDLRAVTGRLDEANADFEWLVDFYNENDVEEAETLRWIGMGAAQFARWNRLSDQFGFLVNEYYPELFEAAPSFWPAHYEMGRLFAEKYNDAEAAKEFKAAQVINPNAAEVLTAVGTQALDQFEIGPAQAACEQALAINPELLAAHHLQADIHLANFDARAAAGVLTDALKLNPLNQETLGRLAAAYLSADGTANRGPDSRFGKLVAAVNERNPHAGYFYLALGDALDRLRRWPAAADYYREAMTRMPRLIETSGRLGMTLMRLGEEEEAQQVLDQSFESDPFNVRVNNTLQVLEILDGYETLETEHFRIKFDGEKDRLTAEYMGRWLEEVYPQLVQQLGFAPPEKSLFEVFNQARNTDGHGWFSARMVGLPRIHPIGACAGKIVALKSPSEGDQRFNWARVLKHEFVHVINLQQTDFNIPHWFTEALAVLNEGYPRPQEWNELLVARSAQDKLFNLENINLGFIRPQSGDDWTLAYCQSEIYAEYVLERFGEDAIAKMLSAYADNLSTAEAIQRSFNVNVPEFERGYQEYVAKIIADLPKQAKNEAKPLAEIQKALVDKPDDPQLLAEAALAQLNRRSYPTARRQADAALRVAPRNQLAHYVRARLHLLVGENREALDRLQENLDRENPQENLLSLLAGLKLRAEDYTAAAELYELGAAHDPGGSKWLKSLAAVHLKSGDESKLRPVLEQLAEVDPDDLTLRKKLAQLAVQLEDWPAAARWTLEGLHIHVQDANLHVWRAMALVGQGEASEGAAEYAVAVELLPDDPKLRFDQAQALVQADKKAEARSVLEELLKRDANYPGADELLKTLK